jgi:hypothetical protein
VMLGGRHCQTASTVPCHPHVATSTFFHRPSPSAGPRVSVHSALGCFCLHERSGTHACIAQRKADRQ